MENLQPTLTPEEVTLYEEKAQEIAKARGVQSVHPVVFIKPDTHERIVAYLRQPTFTEKLYAMDTAISAGVYMSASNLMELLLIKEESHQLATSDAPQADDVRMGIVDYCLNMVSRYQNQFKKK